MKIFLNFARDRTRDEWVLGEPIDAEVVVAARGVSLQPEMTQPLHLIWVLDRQDAPLHGGLDGLTRPLQLESFLSLIHKIEQGELAASSMAEQGPPSTPAVPASPRPALVSSTPLTEQPAPVRAREDELDSSALTMIEPDTSDGADGPDTVRMPLTMLSTAVAPAPFVTPAPPRASPPHARHLAEGRWTDSRFHLKRWPSVRNLKVHRYLPRLASFLSSRHMSVFELSQLSNVSPEECEEFLRDMEAQGILERQDSAPAQIQSAEHELPPGLPGQPAVLVEVAPTHAPAPTIAGPVAMSKPPVLGLVSRLRSRLGLK